MHARVEKVLCACMCLGSLMCMHVFRESYVHACV